MNKERLLELADEIEKAKPAELPKMHRLRFVEQDPPRPARWRKEREVLQGDSVASTFVTYSHTITIDKEDIEFILEGDV